MRVAVRTITSSDASERARHQKTLVPFRRRASAPSPYPLPSSSLSRRTRYAGLRREDAGVRCMMQCKPVDRSPFCWEIQKGGSPFGRFKGFPKGENEIPLWRALSFRFHPVSFCTSRKKWGGFLLHCVPCSSAYQHLIRASERAHSALFPAEAENDASISPFFLSNPKQRFGFVLESAVPPSPKRGRLYKVRCAVEMLQVFRRSANLQRRLFDKLSPVFKCCRW